ncbi:uncharacterized protein LOC105847943 [Hydra vulgaris]|uniref:uncharacterized protein LOC105847943 n=1 Tax=Hydra vulgaris TaxID=6087 RepID=UPI0032EA4AC0
MFVRKYTYLLYLEMVTMSAFKYLHGAVELYQKNEVFVLTSDNLLKTFQIFPIEYEITFEVFLSSFTSGYGTPDNGYCQCANLFRFTIGTDDSTAYGNRILGVWFQNTGVLTYDSYKNGTNYRVTTSSYSAGLKKFNLSQLLYHGDYISTLKVDGITISSVKNADAKVFENVKMYFSDGFYMPQPGTVRNLLVTKGCSESNSYCKPNLNVQINWLIIENVLNISFQVTYNSIEELAYNVVWEYFLPRFVTLQSEITPLDAVKFSASNLKYKISNLQSNGNSQNITVLVNNYKCFLGDSFHIEIPFKLYYENSAASSWNSFHVIRNSLKENCKSFRLPIDQNHATEYYGQGVYWDDISSQIYLCINQYVTNFQKPTCFSSKDDGLSWQAMDVRIGAVLGHHTSKRELYAIHRNQKLYLMFHNLFKKWLVLTNNDFKKDIVNQLNLSKIKPYKEDVEYNVTFGTKQWMGNQDGLHFKNLTDSTWIRRFKWNV